MNDFTTPFRGNDLEKTNNASSKPAESKDAVKPNAADLKDKVVEGTKSKVSDLKAELAGPPVEAAGGVAAKPAAGSSPAENVKSNTEDEAAKAGEKDTEKPAKKKKEDKRGIMERLMSDPMGFFKNSPIMNMLMNFPFVRNLVLRLGSDSLGKDVVLKNQDRGQGLNSGQLASFDKLKDLLTPRTRQINPFGYLAEKLGVAAKGIEDLVSIGRKTMADVMIVKGEDKAKQKVPAFREYAEFPPDPSRLRFRDIVCYKVGDDYVPIVVGKKLPNGTCVYMGREYNFSLAGNLPQPMVDAGATFHVAYQRRNNDEMKEAYAALEAKKAKGKQKPKAAA